LYTDASEKIADVKAKVAKINAEDKKSVEHIGVIFNDNHLDNDKTVGESKVENDNIVYLVYKKDGSNEWEAVDVQKVKEEEKKDWVSIQWIHNDFDKGLVCPFFLVDCLARC